MLSCGVDHKKLGLSPHLVAWVKQGDRMVCGVIGQGTSRSLTSKWDAPLEQSNLGADNGVMDFGKNALQATTGMTSVTAFSSTQIWNGSLPLRFTLTLLLLAFDNPQEEVEKAIQWLEEFSSGEVQGFVAFNPLAAIGGDAATGRIPEVVTLNVGRNQIIPNCVIESITTPTDKERGPDGSLLRAEIQLDIQTKTMLSKSDIAALWQGGIAVQ